VDKEEKMNRLRALFIVLVAGILVSSITIYPTNSLALPFEVELLGSTYTTSVNIKVVEPCPCFEASRTQSSSTPIGDFMYGQTGIIPGNPLFPGIGTAAAEAKAFEVTVSGGTDYDMRAGASAQSEMIFSPLLNGIANLTVDITRDFDFIWTDGNVSMFDRTSNQQLWNYGWNILQQGNVPWNGACNTPFGCANANLTLDTYFAKDHIYDLSMFVRMGSDKDNELANIKLSGLKIVSVPEPSSLLLLGSGLAILVAWRRKQDRLTTHSA
jgi:hypothetical protein